MDNIPCKWFEHWRENHGPIGECWMEDMSGCGRDLFEDESIEMTFEEYGNCDSGCPGYEPLEVITCEKHGEFIKEYGCDGCMYDDYIECQRMGKEYCWFPQPILQ